MLVFSSSVNETSMIFVYAHFHRVTEINKQNFFIYKLINWMMNLYQPIGIYCLGRFQDHCQHLKIDHLKVTLLEKSFEIYTANDMLFKGAEAT